MGSFEEEDKKAIGLWLGLGEDWASQKEESIVLQKDRRKEGPELDAEVQSKTV